MRHCWSTLGEVFLIPRFSKPYVFPFIRVEKGFASECSKLVSAVPSYCSKLRSHPAQAVAKNLRSGRTDRFDTTPSRVRYEIMVQRSRNRLKETRALSPMLRAWALMHLRIREALEGEMQYEQVLLVDLFVFLCEHVSVLRNRPASRL